MPNNREKRDILGMDLEAWWRLRRQGLGACGYRGCRGEDGRIRLVIPGSFNPLHRGHLAMARHASMLTGETCYFELSIGNVDKPELMIDEVRRRVDQAFGENGLLISNAARFNEKSRLFPQATFGLGADTLIRLDDVRYHQDQVSRRDAAVAEIAENGCRFLVFGRLLGNKFVDSQNMQIGDDLRALCDFVPRSDFEIDVSSTHLREESQ